MLHFHWGPEAHNAEEAAKKAYDSYKVMVPGSFGYTTLVQLGHAHELKCDKETTLLKAIDNLGLTLKIKLKSFPLLAQKRNHTCVPIRAFAEMLVQEYPQRILAGYDTGSMDAFEGLLERFWKSYRVQHSYHPVFEHRLDSDLRQYIPIKIHTDEGTGLRKTAIYQYSWGPVIPKNMKSCNRYFFWSCIFHEQYKHHHAGFQQGNAVL